MLRISTRPNNSARHGSNNGIQAQGWRVADSQWPVAISVSREWIVCGTASGREGGGWELHEKVIEVEGEKWQSTSPQTRPDSPLDQLLRNQILPE